MVGPHASVREKDSVDDPVELILRKTGCIELHFKVQECIAEKQDWRKCQDEVLQFRNYTNFVPFFTGVAVAFACQIMWKKRLPLNILRTGKALTMHGKVKMVLVVRTDLKMGTGKIASQCAHAAVTCYNSSLMTYPEISTKWKLLGQPKIVLKVNENGDHSLQLLNKKALESGIISCLIKDAGRTQVEPGCVTVLGIGPGDSEKIDAVTKHLKLL